MPLLPKEPLVLATRTVDFHRRLVMGEDGDGAVLTAREVDLLAYLVRHAGRTVDREELLVEVWGYSADMVTRTVDNTIRRLRTKVEHNPREPQHVLTIFGEGYTFVPWRTTTAAPTSGPVSLVVVRVEGLDGLRARNEELATASLDVLHRVITAAAASAGAPVLGSADAPLMAVGDPHAAAALAIATQQAAFEADWPIDLLTDPAGSTPRGATGSWRGLRLAIAVASGTAELLGDHYEGPAVDAARQLVSAAHGGQVLVGPEVWRAAGPFRDLGVQTTPLGALPLVVGAPGVPVVALVSAGFADRSFPPPRTVDARRTNLDAEVDSFVGRRQQIQALRGLFARGAGLVTVLGTAGAGKTRIARRYGAIRVDALSSGGGGVWFCDLAACNTLEEVVAAVAGALGVPLDPDRDAVQDRGQVGRALDSRRKTLLILDNAEQVTAALAECVQAWRLAAPECRMLVTSRHALGLADARVFQLPPLEPAEALALFVDRARAVRLDLELEPEDLPAVQEIAEQLDFNPLALELAAVRVRVLPPRRMVQRLHERFAALGRGPKDRPERHATLDDAIAWSWTLLEPWAQSAFAQLGAFRGGLDVKAARAILQLGPDGPSVDEAIAELRDRCLLRIVEPVGLPGEMRLVLLESLGAWARARLVEREDAAAVRARHRNWYAELGALLSRKRDTEPGSQAGLWLRLEVGNLREAHRDALANDADAACRLAVVLDEVLAPRGPYEDHLHLLDDTVAVCADAQPHSRVALYLARARAHEVRGEVPDTERDLVSAARAARLGRQPSDMAHVLASLGRWVASRGRVEDADRLLIAAEQQALASGDPGAVARVNAVRARHLAGRGLIAQAVELGRVALAQYRAAPLRRAEGALLVDLAGWLTAVGGVDEARELHRQALGLAREWHDLRLEARILTWLGALLHEVGRLDAAADHLTLAESLQAQVGDRRWMGIARGHLGAVRAEQGQHADAMALLDSAMSDLDEAADHRLQGWFNGWRAAVLTRTGQLDAAVDATRRSLTQLQEADDRRLEGRVTARSALLLMALGRTREAESALEHADRLLGAVGDADGLRGVVVLRDTVQGRPVERPPGARLEARWASM
ncbi:MAG: winged helix-turn-helix domain-containing protein [Myxococcota bacterium]